MEIKDYLPKRIRNRVVRVDVDADFDYEKNRSVQHYFVTLDDGMEFDATTIKELKEIAKKIKQCEQLWEENIKIKLVETYLYDIQDELCDKIVHHWEDDQRFANQREMQQYNCGIAEAMEIIRNVLDGREFKSSLLQSMKE